MEVSVDGRLELMGNFAFISTETFGQGKGGKISVQADSLLIDAKNGYNGITSQTSGSGDGGIVDMDVIGLMEVLSGGIVGTSTFSQGDAGDITIHAGDIHVLSDKDAYAGFQSDAYGEGNGGSVNVLCQWLFGDCKWG